MQYMSYWIILVLSSTAFGGETRVGGKTPLSGKDFGSELFTNLVKQANHKCNSVAKHELWFKPDAILGGTKQVVSGIIYDFTLRQRGTLCKREEMLKSEPGQNEHFCAPNDNSTAVCIIKIWHRPWIKFTEIKIADLWLLESDNKFISEEIRLLNETDNLYETMLIEGALANDRDMQKSEKLFKLSQAKQTTRQFDGEHTYKFDVTLSETSCPNEKDKATNAGYITKKCYNEQTGENLNCVLPFDGNSKASPKFSQCRKMEAFARGMWRSTMPRSTTSNVCNFGENRTENGTESSKHSQFFMNNHARSNIRILSEEEQNEEVFQNLLDKILAQYIIRNGSNSAYKIRKIESAKVESEPSPTTLLSLWVEISSCAAGNSHLMTEDGSTKMCETSDQDQKIEKCQVTVTFDKTEINRKENITFGPCKVVLGATLFLVGGSSYSKPGSEAYVTSLSLAGQAIERYNSESNDLYEYQLDGIKNPSSQIVSGTVYTMNVSMKAVTCKNTRDATCLSPDVEVYRHCVISAKQHPAAAEPEMNITDCWRQIKMKRPIEGLLEFLPPEKLFELKQGRLLNKLEKEYYEMHKYLENTKVDYLTGGIKLTDGENEMIVFNMHLNGKEDNTLKYKCKVAVLYKNDELIQQKLWRCKEEINLSKKKRLLGSPKPIEKETQIRPDFQSKVKQSVEKFNQMRNDLFYHRLLRIENPTTQVVAGKLTSFRMHLQQTNCTKNKHSLWQAINHPHLCGALNNTHTISCLVKIWEKPSNQFAEIDLQRCDVSELPVPIPLQSNSDDFQATDAFKRLLKTAALLFSMNSDKPVLYKEHFVDSVVRTADKPNEVKFSLTMKQTRCQKWDDLFMLRIGQDEWCSSSKSSDHFARCNVKATETETGFSIKLDDCELIYFGEYSAKRPLLGRERLSPRFLQVVDKAIDLFNRRVSSPYRYKLLTFENPAIEFISGLQYEFTLHLIPTTCHPPTTDFDIENCTDVRPEFMVTCQARYWQRAWLTEHETLDVTDCEVTSISQNSTSNEVSPVERTKNMEEYMRCLIAQEKRFVNLFMEKVKPEKQHQREEFENVDRSVAPGSRLTFDLYLKPELNIDACVNDQQELCSNDANFYLCHGTYWYKPWNQAESLEVGPCMKVSQISSPSGKEVDDKTQVLKEAVTKAVELYNEKLAEFYYFEQETTDNLNIDNSMGKKITFELVMKPKSCKPTLGRRRCEPDLSKTRIRCSVTIRKRPWLGEEEGIWLQNCYEYFSHAKDLEAEPVSEEEKTSVAFRETLKQLPKLYAGPIPIEYKLEKYENALVRQNDTHRVLTLSFVLEPSGCDSSKPNANDPACRDWLNQDKVRCDAERIQRFDGNMMTTIRLTGCSPIMKPVKKRTLKPSEYDSVTMRQSLKSAWNLIHQITANSPQLYRVVEIKSGTIERQDVERIEYVLELEETVCRRGHDEHRFVGVHAPGCEPKEPQVKKTCQVEVINNNEGQHVSVSCTA